MLSAEAARLSIEQLCVRVHSTSVELSVAELAIHTRFKFYSEGVVCIIPEAENLLVHVDLTVVYRVTSESGAHI